MSDDEVTTMADMDCVPCQGGVPPMERQAAEAMLKNLDPSWSLNSAEHLFRVFNFDDFVTALAFVNRLGSIAEEQWHHPDLELGWGRVGVEIWTHKIDGLAEADFILAAKFDRAYQQ